ncbi:SDR family oxidoreductase [Sporichthya sp.]|uniref:SDR family oxidoreductase n=1 Tax=Sporichthya sp. TaxID=65475 RepID=UPI0017E3DDBA|nr:SDR family oxidoreductase [Sporichthya sp.]MBA3742512.1 SDR family oxidoreductase [Sporichthya sp.]
MAWQLAGETAIVTGGAGGIGSRIVAELAGLGARVAILDKDEVGAQKVAAEHGAIAIGMDLTDPASVAAAYRAAVEAIGPIDLLVNNAGWDKVGPFVDSDPAIWDVLIAINLRGPIQLTQLAVPSMIERGNGRLIYTSSDAGRVGSKGEAVYAACKGGIIAFAKTMAREVARKGITANAVCPGPTETPLLNEALGENPGLVTALGKAVPMGRIGTPEDVAPVVAFLATKEAGFITGQAISVSGGLTMS